MNSDGESVFTQVLYLNTVLWYFYFIEYHTMPLNTSNTFQGQTFNFSFYLKTLVTLQIRFFIWAIYDQLVKCK